MAQTHAQSLTCKVCAVTWMGVIRLMDPGQGCWPTPRLGKNFRLISMPSTFFLNTIPILARREGVKHGLLHQRTLSFSS